MKSYECCSGTDQRKEGQDEPLASCGKRRLTGKVSTRSSRAQFSSSQASDLGAQESHRCSEGVSVQRSRGLSPSPAAPLNLGGLGGAQRLPPYTLWAPSFPLPGALLSPCPVGALGLGYFWRPSACSSASLGPHMTSLPEVGLACPRSGTQALLPTPEGSSLPQGPKRHVHGDKS